MKHFFRASAWQLLLPLAVLGCCLAAPAQAQLVSKTYVANYTNFANPERGLAIPTPAPWPWMVGLNDQYRDNIPGFELIPESWTPPLDEALMRQERLEKGCSVRKVGYTIAMFRNADLSAAFLSRLTEDFARARRAGVKLWIRFGYGFLGGRPDAPKARILRHLQQLKPILHQNEDVLACMDAGFVGYWGEWHDSTSGNLEDPYSDVGATAREILDSIFTAVPRSRMVNFRYPGHKSRYFRPAYYLNSGPNGSDPDAWQDAVPMPGAAQAYNGSNMSRAGNHTDGLHANAYDAAYGWDAESVARLPIKARVAEENKYVVQAGEIDGTVGGFEQTEALATSERMLTEGRRMRWSLMNAWDEYTADNGGVMDRWRADGKYDEIARSMGYRFRLLQSRATEAVAAGGAFQLGLDIANDGWATPYNPRGCEIILRHRSTGQKTVLRPTVNADPRRWLPEGNGQNPWHTLFLSTTLSAGLPAGSYDILLNLPDPLPSLHDRPEYSIRLANQDVWEASTGYNKLNHTLTISSPAATVQRIEAETGVLTGVSVSSQGTRYSSTGYVNGSTLDQTGDQVSVTFSVPTAGTYPLTIGYNTQPFGDQKYQELIVNGGAARSVRFPLSTGWATVTESVSLRAGSNTIVLRKGWGWMHVDYFELGPAAATTAARSTVAGTPLATDAAGLALTVYPNPGQKLVQAEYHVADAQPVSWVLYNAYGRAVQASGSRSRQQFGGAHRLTLDVSRLPDGLYFLHLTAGGQTAKQPLRLQRQ